MTILGEFFIDLYKQIIKSSQNNRGPRTAETILKRERMHPSRWYQDLSQSYGNYADDTTLAAVSEELKSLLMKVKEESVNVSLKLNIWKTKIMASGPITSWEIDGETMETVTDFILGLQNHCRW